VRKGFTASPKNLVVNDAFLGKNSFIEIIAIGLFSVKIDFWGRRFLFYLVRGKDECCCLRRLDPAKIGSDKNDTKNFTAETQRTRRNNFSLRTLRLCSELVPLGFCYSLLFSSVTFVAFVSFDQTFLAPTYVRASLKKSLVTTLKQFA